MDRTYLAAPKSPLREVLKAMTGKAPPKYVKGYSSTELTEQEQSMLQDWAVNHVRPAWLTGIGLIEAADQQVAEAVSNGNIPPNPKEVQQPSAPRAVEDDDDDDHDRGPGEEWAPVHSERERFCSD